MIAIIAICSSIYTAATLPIADDFGVSREVSTLGVTTFLLSFTSGPLVFDPLPEVV
jgi:DHA1 family multidrug resistance protein-like MFS transporter